MTPGKVPLKPLVWMGSSRADLSVFSDAVRGEMGFALYLAQCGEKHPKVKPLKGFGGAGVLEVAADWDGDTFRAVYTVRLAGTVYVLHVFQKKAKRGIATPRRDMDLIARRLKDAEALHARGKLQSKE